MGMGMDGCSSQSKEKPTPCARVRSLGPGASFLAVRRVISARPTGLSSGTKTAIETVSAGPKVKDSKTLDGSPCHVRLRAARAVSVSVVTSQVRTNWKIEVDVSPSRLCADLSSDVHDARRPWFQACVPCRRYRLRQIGLRENSFFSSLGLDAKRRSNF